MKDIIDTEPGMRVITGKFGDQPPRDLAENLRSLADAVDRGEVTSLVAAYVEDDSYSFMFGASLKDAIFLTALLQKRNLDRMVVPE